MLISVSEPWYTVKECRNGVLWTEKELYSVVLRPVYETNLDAMDLMMRIDAADNEDDDDDGGSGTNFFTVEFDFS